MTKKNITQHTTNDFGSLLVVQGQREGEMCLRLLNVSLELARVIVKNEPWKTARLHETHVTLTDGIPSYPIFIEAREYEDSKRRAAAPVRPKKDKKASPPPAFTLWDREAIKVIGKETFIFERPFVLIDLESGAPLAPVTDEVRMILIYYKTELGKHWLVREDVFPDALWGKSESTVRQVFMAD